MNFDKDLFVKIINQIVTYFIEVFKYFGYITDEDIETVNGIIGEFTK